ncbi:MAG: hypothetical protein QOG10_6897 [Kribbellaceae bacterium]|nr:hypothetical protein [Kribbellaceae bacterium]
MASATDSVKKAVPLQLIPRPARHAVLTRQPLGGPSELELEWPGQPGRPVANGHSVTPSPDENPGRRGHQVNHTVVDMSTTVTAKQYSTTQQPAQDKRRVGGVDW